MNIFQFCFILFNSKIQGEIVTPLKQLEFLWAKVKGDIFKISVKSLEVYLLILLVFTVLSRACNCLSNCTTNIPACFLCNKGNWL